MHYLVEDLVDKVDVVAGGEQDAVHHLVHVALLLLDATQAGVAGPPVRQRATVGVALLRLPRGAVGLPLSSSTPPSTSPGPCPLLLVPLPLLLLAATACSHSLGAEEQSV